MLNRLAKSTQLVNGRAEIKIEVSSSATQPISSS